MCNRTSQFDAAHHPGMTPEKLRFWINPNDPTGKSLTPLSSPFRKNIPLLIFSKSAA
jgi:hypothetical protein